MKAPRNKKMRVVELFAGVGGFRLGLEAAGGYEIVWSNQWEPGKKVQHASEVYIKRFGAQTHSNKDIAQVPVSDIPDHDLLVGGFPCQDYSVARTLSHAAGIVGKKGVLWWEIYRILKQKGKKAPDYLMLENVDRLLKSPANKRGRDFAIMLASLSDLGYVVEWRVINAADYGMPQRRRRVFILGYKKNSEIYKKAIRSKPENWMEKEGTMAQAFPITHEGLLASPKRFSLEGSLPELSENFDPKVGNFLNTGVMVGRKVWTLKTKPIFKGKTVALKDVLLKEKEVPEQFFIKKSELPQWKYQKGGKKEERRSKSGYTYFYTEGPIVFPDPLSKPSRTIVTGEGGATPSRFKHVVETSSGRYRRLMPIELERLCMFPDDHTAGKSDTTRAFFMGNALVVGIIKKLGGALLRQAKA